MNDGQDERAASEPQGGGPGRRVVAGMIAVAGAAAVSAVAIEPVRAATWTSPAIKTALGAPAAAASIKPYQYRLDFRFVGSQHVTTTAGSSVTLPASLAVTHSGGNSRVSATALRITMTLDPVDVPLIDATASAAAATVNGEPAPTLFEAFQVHDSSGGVWFDNRERIEPGSAVVIPLVVSLSDPLPARDAGTITASYTNTADWFTPSDDVTPAAARVAQAMTAIVASDDGPFRDIDLTFAGEQTTRRAPDGKAYRIPARIVLRNGPDLPAGTLQPIPAGATIRMWLEYRTGPEPDDWDTSYGAKPFLLTSGAPLFNGVPSSEWGLWELEDQAVRSTGIVLKKALAQGDVLEIPIVPTTPEDRFEFKGETRTRAEIDRIDADDPSQNNVAIGTFVQIQQPPAPASFDAAVSFEGSTRVLQWRSVPTHVVLTGGATVVPAGTQIAIDGDISHGMYVDTVGMTTIDGVDTPGAAYVAWYNNYPNLAATIVLMADLPARSTFVAPLTFQVSSARGRQTITAQVLADGDTSAANSTAVRKTTF